MFTDQQKRMCWRNFRWSNMKFRRRNVYKKEKWAKKMLSTLTCLKLFLRAEEKNHLKTRYFYFTWIFLFSATLYFYTTFQRVIFFDELLCRSTFLYKNNIWLKYDRLLQIKLPNSTKQSKQAPPGPATAINAAFCTVQCRVKGSVGNFYKKKKKKLV